MYVCASVLTMLSLFIKMVLIGITGASNHDPNTMAVVINKDSSKLEDYIQIRNPPSTIKGHRVVVEYRCTHDRIVGLEVQTDVEHQSAQKVFQKIWKCRASLDKGATKLKRIKLKLPPAIQNNYNIFNKQVKFTSKTKVRAWILERDWWPSCFKQRNCYTRSSVKVAYDTKIPSPFSRPYIHVGKDCRKWSWDVLTFMTSYKIPTCSVEAEIVEVIEYPVVIGGNPYGVYRKLHPYKNPELEEKRKAMFHKPRFTISIWLYILEYCPGTEHSGKLCSIMFHSNWKMEYRTLLFFITPEGRFHIQIQHTDGQTSAGVTNSVAPLHQWIRVVLTFNTNKWSIVINHGEEFNETQESSYTHPGTAAYMDDTEGLFSFGGAEHVHGFRGYIGQASYYRNKIVDHKKIPFPSRYHPMFELKLTRREERCKNYIDWVNQRVKMYKKRLRKAFLKSTCHRYLIEMIKNITHPKTLPYCKPNACKSKHWSLVDRIVKRLVSTGEQIDFRLVADELYSNATQLLDESLHNIPAAFPILKQAACYGNNDAMYMVSVILNNGIHVKADEIQSQAYLMLAALENHRLSALALGHKHRYGIDGVPLDFEQSYVNASEASTLEFTLENNEKSSIRYKFRCPPMNVIKVNQPTGSVAPSEIKQLKLVYSPQMNTTGDNLISIQLKCIVIGEGMQNTDDLFKSHKNKETTRFLSVHFEDMMNDDMFMSPQVSKAYSEEVEIQKNDKWWQK